MSRKLSRPGAPGSLSIFPTASHSASASTSSTPHNHHPLPPPIVTVPASYSTSVPGGPESANVSPRKTPGSPSPTFSTYSTASIVRPWDDRATGGGGGGSRTQSLDVPRDSIAGLGMTSGPPVPSKSEKRLPAPPSPHRQGSRGWALGVYDNKLVSSTLSHLPPIPPLSPSAVSSTASNLSNASHTSSGSHHGGSTVSAPGPSSIVGYPSAPHSSSATPRPSLSLSNQAGGGAVYLPDGTVLSTSSPEPGGDRGDRDRERERTREREREINLDRERERTSEVGSGRTVMETMAHSSPNSPWSLLTVHVLPVFAGSPLKTPIEDLNQLCTAHILATSQRAPASRLIAILSNDLRDFIASGMLTLKAKFDTLEEAKVVSRSAEVWSFFWGQILPYVEGVFLPCSQVRDSPATTSHSSMGGPSSISGSSIPVKHFLLSGFLLHILLPLLPRLIPLITSAPLSPSPPNTAIAASGSPPALHPSSSFINPPSLADMQRLLQMSLVLSTQARYSSFFPMRDAHESALRDAETSESVAALGRAVRWRMVATATPLSGTNGDTGASADATTGSPVRPAGGPGSGSTGGPAAQQRNSLQRGPSILGQKGRIRRRGWRASSTFGQLGFDPDVDGSNLPTGGGGGTGTRTQPGRQNSDFLQAPEARWGRPRVDEEDEDEASTLGYHYTGPMNGGNGVDGSLYAPTMSTTATGSTATSTLGASTVRGESLASYAESQRTPVSDFHPRRMARQASGGM